VQINQAGAAFPFGGTRFDVVGKFAGLADWAGSHAVYNSIARIRYGWPEHRLFGPPKWIRKAVFQQVASE